MLANDIPVSSDQLNKLGMHLSIFLTNVANSLLKGVENKFAVDLDKYQDTVSFKNHHQKLVHDIEGQISRIKLDNDKKIVEVLDTAAKSAAELYAVDFR